MTRTKVINSPKNTIEEKEIKAGGSYPLKPEPHLTKNTRFVIRTSKSRPEAQLFFIALVTLLRGEGVGQLFMLKMTTNDPLTVN